MIDQHIDHEGLLVGLYPVQLGTLTACTGIRCYNDTHMQSPHFMLCLRLDSCTSANKNEGTSEPS